MIGVQEMVFITQQQHSDTVYHFDKNSDKRSLLMYVKMWKCAKFTN